MLILLEKIKKAHKEKLIDLCSYLLRCASILKGIIHDLISISILFFKFLLYSILAVSIFWLWHKTFPTTFKSFSQYMRLFEGIACNIPIASDCFTTIINTAEEAVKSSLREIHEQHELLNKITSHIVSWVFKTLDINNAMVEANQQYLDWREGTKGDLYYKSRVDVENLHLGVTKKIAMFSLVLAIIKQTITFLQIIHIPKIEQEIETIESSYQYLNSPTINSAINDLRFYAWDYKARVSKFESYVFEIDKVLFQLNINKEECVLRIIGWPDNYDPNISAWYQDLMQNLVHGLVEGLVSSAPIFFLGQLSLVIIKLFRRT